MLRQVECTGAPIVPPSRDYFAFVYGSHNRAGDLGTLALGYGEWSDDPGLQLAPTIKWLDKTTLLVGMGLPAYITRKRRDIQGVHITYGPGGTMIRDDYVLVPCPNRALWCDR